MIINNMVSLHKAKAHFSEVSDTDDAHTVLPHRSIEPVCVAVGPACDPTDIIRCRCSKRSLAEPPVVPKIIPANWFLTVLLLDVWIIEVPRVDRLAIACLPCWKQTGLKLVIYNTVSHETAQMIYNIGLL